MKGVKIAGIGIELPRRSYTNDQVAQMLSEQKDHIIAELPEGVMLTPERAKEFETNGPWIEKRVGVKTRPFAESDETTSDLATKAGHNALDDAYGEAIGKQPEFSIVCTVSPDYFTTPPTNIIVSRKMGISRETYVGDEKKLRRYFSADVTQACSSFGEGLLLGTALIQAGYAQRGIVHGADTMSRTMSKNRRSPFVILGDGAGAIALEACPETETWIQPQRVFAGVDGGKDGEYEQAIINRAGGAHTPITPEHLNPLIDAHLMFMNGNFVYKTLVPLVSRRVIPDALDYAGLSLRDIDVLILHQANHRMTEAVVARLHKQCPDCVIWIANQENVKEILKRIPNEPQDKHHIICYCTIDHTGNLTSANIPVSLYEAREHGVIVPGKRVQVIVFGGGYSWVSIIIDWGGAHLFIDR